MRTTLALALFTATACTSPTAPSNSAAPTAAGHKVGHINSDTGGTPPPAPAPKTANLTGRWLSDTVTLPGVAGQECDGVTQVEFLISQQGQTLTGWELHRFCGVPGIPTDSAAQDSGTVSSLCLPGRCAVAYNMVVADSGIWTEGGNWRLALSKSGDTLFNVTPPDVNHSYMPTLFVKQP